jgi:hypothetical protein
MRLAPPLNTAGHVARADPRHAEPRGELPRRQAARAHADGHGLGQDVHRHLAIYRLVKEGGARRVLFLVDRGNLGRQALKEFQAYTTPDDGGSSPSCTTSPTSPTTRSTR